MFDGFVHIEIRQPVGDMFRLVHQVSLWRIKTILLVLYVGYISAKRYLNLILLDVRITSEKRGIKWPKMS